MFKVMIVDDIEIMRRSIKRLKLWGETSGFSITDEAKDGVEALEKLKDNPVDLVITDIRMPRMDGIELMKKIYERQLSTCIVMLSDYTEFSYARQGFVYGAFDYLGKPIEEKELAKLLERVREYLRKKKQEDEMVKRLEEIAATKVEVFYPQTEVNYIIELLRNGDEGAIKVASSLGDTINSAVDKDSLKTAFVLKKALGEIVDSIAADCNWISEFMDINLVKNIDFSKYKQQSEMARVFTDRINEIVIILNKFALINTGNSTIKHICKFVLDHTATDISVKAISESLYINRNYLSDMFKQRIGMSLVEYLTMIKMERAKRLVVQGELKNYEIAEKLGFKDVEYFSKLFKKYTGKTPTEYRH